MPRKAFKPWFRAGRGWYVTMNGNEQIPLGVTDPQDEAGAWAVLRQMQQQLSQVAAAVTAQAGAAKVRPEPLAELVPAFLDEKRGQIEPATLRSYTQHLKWLVGAFGKETVAGLDLAALVREAGKVESWGDTHRANVLGTTAALLKWAGRADKVALPAKQSRGADSVIPEPLYRRCLAEAGGDFRQLLRFLWLVGCRPGEATGLTVEAVGWDTGTIRLKEHKTKKKGKTRILYLAKEAVEVLVDQREKHKTGLLFRGLRGRRLSLQAMTMRFERLSEKVGQSVTSYMFRHTWATRALVAGVPAAQVAAMMGHSSTAMIFKHYSHLTNEAELLKAQADRVAGGAPPPKAAG